MTGLKIMKGVGTCQNDAAGFVRLLPRRETFHIVIIYFSRLNVLCACASFLRVRFQMHPLLVLFDNVNMLSSMVFMFFCFF